MERQINKLLLELVADERFVLLESLAKRPNLFKIVGRTHQETWHSMFLGWLLDPKGSHGLGDFSLKRLLVALTNPDLQEDDVSKANEIARIAALGDFSNASVTPNEDLQKEYECAVGRIDVFVTGIICDKKETVLLIEQKVKARIDHHQCKKYGDWLDAEHPEANKILLLLAPGDSLKSSIEATTDDGRWNAINYQTLHDKVLVPVLHSPELSTTTQPLISQYIDLLRAKGSDEKGRLAVTQEEKELALELYEKHKDAFEAISCALKDTYDIGAKLDVSQNLPLSISIKETSIIGKTVPDLFLQTLTYLVDNKCISVGDVPFSTGTQNHLVAREPKHPNGKPFRVPIEYEGFFMEANKSKSQAIKDIIRFLKAIGCPASMLSDA